MEGMAVLGPPASSLPITTRITCQASSSSHQFTSEDMGSAVVLPLMILLAFESTKHPALSYAVRAGVGSIVGIGVGATVGGRVTESTPICTVRDKMGSGKGRWRIWLVSVSISKIWW